MTTVETRPDPPSAVEAVRNLVGEISGQRGLVELRDQILTGSATPEATTKKEKSPVLDPGQAVRTEPGHVRHGHPR